MSNLRTLGGWQADYRPCPTCQILVREPHGIEWCRAALAGRPGPGAVHIKTFPTQHNQEGIKK